MAGMDGRSLPPPAACILGLGLAAGCASGPPGPGAPAGMSELMHSKLRHAQEALAAVVRADFAAIEKHATALGRISTGSMVLPQDTLSYSVLAEQFQEVAARLAARAAARDLEGVTASWVDLNRTCVACHSGINHERLLRDVPGQVSRRGPAAAGAAEDPGS
jgi:hypothetical protein